MPLTWLTWMLCIVLCPLLNGCIAFYRYVPVEVTLTELASGEPAEGVPVGVTYGSAYILNPPRKELRITDADGSVILPIATFAQVGPPRLEVGGELLTEVRGEVLTLETHRTPKTYHFTVPLELLREGGFALFDTASFPDAPRYEVHIKPTKR